MPPMPLLSFYPLPSSYPTTSRWLEFFFPLIIATPSLKKQNTPGYPRTQTDLQHTGISFRPSLLLLGVHCSPIPGPPLWSVGVCSRVWHHIKNNKTKIKDYRDRLFIMLPDADKWCSFCFFFLGGLYKVQKARTFIPRPVAFHRRRSPSTPSATTTKKTSD